MVQWILGNLEAQGLVRSSRDTENPELARSVYKITNEGLDYIHIWAVEIRDTPQLLESFLSEYETSCSEKISKQNLRTSSPPQRPCSLLL